jgi:hypothetical protein
MYGCGVAPWGASAYAALNTDAALCEAAGGRLTRKARTAAECGTSYDERCFSWDGEPSLRTVVGGTCPRCLPDMSEAIRPMRGYTWTAALYTRNGELCTKPDPTPAPNLCQA